VHITLGDILSFVFILIVGYTLANLFAFALRKLLLSRFSQQRGLPFAISKVIYYFLLVLVFLAALVNAGMELNKFTLITGALGVGVGFGLQNIVNNFVSGLILQFERPIHIGDVLDIDNTTGKVTRIGIRSSTIKTFQGAEVIIPNANFISGKVINWTLSESLRRVELPVGVAYGSDAKIVSKLLEQAATVHESVLTSPAPAVYFKEFADSSLNFELQFWVMQESNTVKVKSEVALAVMDLLDQAGIEIPYPQRDLRLRAVDPTAAALLASNGSESSSAGPAGDPTEPLIIESPKIRPVGKG
jgi:small-conductance mechanosensitive channel